MSHCDKKTVVSDEKVIQYAVFAAKEALKKSSFFNAHLDTDTANRLLYLKSCDQEVEKAAKILHSMI
jgi:hypothetical protein